MTASWDRQTGETEEWYECFTQYLQMGPERTIAAAYRAAERDGKGAARYQRQSWKRAARRYQWKARAEAYDADGQRPVLVSDERLRMVKDLLDEVYEALKLAEISALSKEEVREALPTFRLFFKDLLQFHKELSEANGGEGGVGLSADDFVALVRATPNVESMVESINRSIAPIRGQLSWLPIRDRLAQLYVDELSARRVVDQAKLDSTRIVFSLRAVDRWHAILMEAQQVGKLAKVIEVAREDYGEDEELQRALLQYGQSIVEQPGRQARRQETKEQSEGEG